jgi:disulfide bond formation protein DsbB
MLSPRNRLPWLLVFVSALLLEGSALYFQYGMGLDPCVLCVYQRAAVLGIALGGLVGALAPQLVVFRVVGYLVLTGAAVLGLRFAIRHVGLLHGSGFECGFLPEFPTWMPLDVWLPALFQPTGLCGEIDWSFFGLSMPAVMVAVFAAYLAAVVYGLAGERRLLRDRQ